MKLIKVWSVYNGQVYKCTRFQSRKQAQRFARTHARHELWSRAANMALASGFTHYACRNTPVL